jgi:hypothetical protein
MSDHDRTKESPKPTARELEREAQRLARVRSLDERRRPRWTPDPDPKEAA